MVKSVGVFNPVRRQIGETITVYSSKKIQFRDTGIFIQSSADGKLLISADGGGADDITLSGGVTIAGDLFVTGDFIFGNAITDTLTVEGATQFNYTVTVGVDDTGWDVQFFGATAGAHLLWDESADSLLLVGGAKLNVQGTVTVGVDDTGYDVQFFGATAGAHMLWDESADELIFSTGASIDITADAVMIDFKEGDASSIDPSATAETGWINLNVGGTKRYVPYYAAS